MKKVDKYLVANSQDNGNADNDKLSKHNENEVILQLDVTRLASNSKLIENNLSMKIIKNIKEVAEKCMTQTMMLCMLQYLETQVI